ncbi:MAG: S8 family peptidase [Candidatus Poribacteria bacterium]|nr:S8 family peptidase [Candidatus Poribacteria bacterium]
MRCRRVFILIGVTVCVSFGATAEAFVAWWVFLNETPSDVHVAEMERHGASVRTVSRWFDAVSVEAEESSLELIAAMPFVRGVSPVRRSSRRWTQETTLSAPQFDAGQGEFQRQQIRANLLRERDLLGLDVKIGVLDTGFRLTHQAFGATHVAATRDFVHGDDIVSDQSGQDDPGEEDHGTRALSIMAANAPGELVGIAPLATYYLAKTEDVTRNGLEFEAHTEEDFWVAGLEWCVDNGCRIVNSSLGYILDYTFPALDGQTSIMSRAIEEAARRGALVVVAAGNTDGVAPAGDGMRGRIGVPADAVSALTVGAVTRAGQPWFFTARGPTFDGRVKPDVAALGSNTIAVSVRDDVGVEANFGTSFAAPLAAGVAALLIDAFPMATVDDLLEAFRSTASKANQPDNIIGYGIVDAERAYLLLADRYTPTAVDPRDTVSVDWARVKRDGLAALGAPYPNPAKAPLAIPIAVEESQDALVQIFGLSGEVIGTLVDAVLDRGSHTFVWDGRLPNGDLASPGVYIVSLTTGDGTQTRRIAWRGR